MSVTVLPLRPGPDTEDFLRAVYDPTVEDAWRIARALLPGTGEAEEAVVRGYVEAWQEWSVSGDGGSPHRLVLPLVQLALREVRAGRATDAIAG